MSVLDLRTDDQVKRSYLRPGEIDRIRRLVETLQTGAMLIDMHNATQLCNGSRIFAVSSMNHDCVLSCEDRA